MQSNGLVRFCPQCEDAPGQSNHANPLDWSPREAAIYTLWMLHRTMTHTHTLKALPVVLDTVVVSVGWERFSISLLPMSNLT